VTQTIENEYNFDAVYQLIASKMFYTLNIQRSYKGAIAGYDITFTTATQVAEYIKNYIDQPTIQDVLSDVEYAELDIPMDDFLPTPLDIDARCDVSGDGVVVFEAGEHVGNAQYFGVVFKVTRKQQLT